MLKVLPPTVLFGALLLGLGACATDGTSPTAQASDQSYTLGSGLMSYDGFRRATDLCKSRGGEVRPKDEGGDMAQMSNYICFVPKKTKS
ncbi:hypothetical protein QO010_000741 [Caulobacter ginsengisoli]|uniref:Lipoprotein n=1 Tax=Caulobacter ginsengisoli TaxID=400775 RepID=A0ABU0ILV0_9CAUL|nr:hypothetical protein [Caulobacter ginsengisoli]MDQ0462993.1 hypothetical protein [Caulobacter ginsengisoli]